MCEYVCILIHWCLVLECVSVRVRVRVRVHYLYPLSPYFHISLQSTEAIHTYIEFTGNFWNNCKLMIGFNCNLCMYVCVCVCVCVCVYWSSIILNDSYYHSSSHTHAHTHTHTPSFKNVITRRVVIHTRSRSKVLQRWW